MPPNTPSLPFDALVTMLRPCDRARVSRGDAEPGQRRVSATDRATKTLPGWLTFGHPETWEVLAGNYCPLLRDFEPGDVLVVVAVRPHDPQPECVLAGRQASRI